MVEIARVDRDCSSMIHLDAWCTGTCDTGSSFLSSPLPLPPGVVTRLPIFTVTQSLVNPLPDFRPNVVRNDTTKLLLRLSSVVSSYARVASPLYPLLAMYIRAPTTRKAGSTQDGQ